MEIIEKAYEAEDFVEVDLRDQQLGEVTFTRCDFSGASLAGAHTARTTFPGMHVHER